MDKDIRYNKYFDCYIVILKGKSYIAKLGNNTLKILPIKKELMCGEQIDLKHSKEMEYAELRYQNPKPFFPNNSK